VRTRREGKKWEPALVKNPNRSARVRIMHACALLHAHASTNAHAYLQIHQEPKLGLREKRSGAHITRRLHYITPRGGHAPIITRRTFQHRKAAKNTRGDHRRRRYHGYGHPLLPKEIHSFHERLNPSFRRCGQCPSHVIDSMNSSFIGL